MSGANKSDFPDSDTRYAEALEELTQSIETDKVLEDVRVYPRLKVDVAALRRRLGLTQQDFADQFGIALGTLRNWEQGRRVPDGPAQLLLLILEQRPDIVLDIFREQEVHTKIDAGISRLEALLEGREVEVAEVIRPRISRLEAMLERVEAERAVKAADAG